MKIVTSVDDWRQLRSSIEERSIGFVPTMGNLHEGHMSLYRRSLAENTLTIASIFVNPSQFNDPNDFAAYPRTLDQDVNMLEQLGVHYVFAPRADEMYPDQYQVRVTETDISKELEGECRPGHFDGMLTVVMKLLNLVQPQKVYLGEKDYQQYLLVNKMVEALFLPIEVVPCPTWRAEDGLALSSRNSRLNQEQRERAAQLPRILQDASCVMEMKQALTRAGFDVDYIAEKWNRRLAAVKLGDVRLIDNFPFIIDVEH